MKTMMSKEYAIALFSLAKENDCEAQYKQGLDLIAEVFEQNPEYVEFLASPGVEKKERLDAIKKAFSESVPEQVVSFLQILCEKNVIRSFKACADEYEKLYEFSQKIITAKVTSAVELTDAEKEKIKLGLEKKTGKTVMLECKVDKSLIGGVMVDMDGTILDGSLRRKLQDVKEVIGK